MVVGVLALQGDFKEHMASLKAYGVKGLEVRTKADLNKVDALILPGGESTTMAKLLVSTGLDKAIVERSTSKNPLPLWGTCAGAILLAQQVEGSEPLDTSFGLVDMTIERNSYGRQTDSFRGTVEWNKERFQAFFIRAPRIKRLGKGARVLARCKGDRVMVRSGQILVTTFHSELKYPNVVLEYFLKMAQQ